MFIKTKKVTLKNGEIRKYYYLAKNIRINGRPVPKVIKYLGKVIPSELLVYFKARRRDQ